MVSHKEAQANQTLLVIDSQQRHRNPHWRQVKSLMPDDLPKALCLKPYCTPA